MPDAPLRWQFTAVSQYEPPALPTVAAARGSWRRLWQSTRHLFGAARENSLPEQLATDRPDERWLASVTPKIDPAGAAADLADHLNHSEGDRDWLTGRLSKSPLRAVIAAPGFQLDEVLRELATQHSLTVLEPPPRESFWDQRAWEPVDFGLDQGDPKRTLVLPDLQRWFLRHEDGLVLVCQLKQQLTHQRRILLGCDSWAWAFLRHAIGMEAIVGEPLTPAALSGCDLENWLRQSCSDARHSILERGSEKPVFHEPETTAQGEGSSYFKTLAARARGNPGVAAALWTESLRTTANDEDDQNETAATRAAAFWVVPLSQLELPDLTGDIDRADYFILHAILLHGGLSLTDLVTVLRFPLAELQRRVHGLRRRGVLQQNNDVFQIRLLVYPDVRARLVSEGFLVDAL